MEERRLIRKVQAGDRLAADALVRSYYDEIHRFVRKQTPDDQTAQDLTQEILISMLRTISHFNPGRAGFRTWLYRIATNKVIDWYRSRSSRITQMLSIDEIEPVDEADISHQVERADFAERVRISLTHFPAHLQKIFRLHVFGDATFAHIAAEMDISENTVKTQYYRLLRQLRKEFSDEEK